METTATQILEIAALGEAPTREFKRELSSNQPSAICKEIAALATSEGGHVLLGVTDDGRVVGVSDAARTLQRIESWIAALVSPKPIFFPQTLIVDAAEVISIYVVAGSGLFYMYENQAYWRVGTLSMPMTNGEIYDHIRGSTTEKRLNALKSEVAAAASLAVSMPRLSTAAMIQDQGELATKNYAQVRDAIFADLEASALVKQLRNDVMLASVTASLATSQGAHLQARVQEVEEKLTDVGKALS